MQNRPLTIVHVNTQRKWFGGEVQVERLVQGLRRRGHRVVMFLRHNGQFVRRATSDGFEVHTFHGRARGPDSLWKMRRLLKQIRPDVVHSHDGHALTASGLASLGLGIPLRVAARRVDFPISSTAKFTRLADVTIAISTAVADVCRQGGIPESMLRIVHSGVDPAKAQGGDRARGRSSLRLANDQPLLLMVAKLTGHKGHTFLLQALPAVLEKFPTTQLALAGDGELAEPLAAEARQLGIADHVQFLGYRDDISDLLKAADLFVMPSYMEGLGTSLLDAIFARCPAVTTAAGGIADVIGIDDPQGPVTFFAAPRDPGALAAGIIRALSSPAEAEQLVERAYARASKMFTDDVMVEGTLSVYREMLAARARTAA